MYYNILMANRMSVVDALYLSWRNVVKHKGRSLIIVLTISILFGLLIGVNLVLRGLEVSLLSAATAETQGSAYVLVCQVYQDHRCKPEVQQDMMDDLGRHGGQKIGEYKVYDFLSRDNVYYAELNQIKVVDFSAVKDFVTIDLNEVPTGRIPILAPMGGFRTKDDGMYDERLRREIDDYYYIVGYLPVIEVEDHTFATPEIGVGNTYTPSVPGGFNLLNLVLGEISAGAINGGMQPIIVDDGSGKVGDYLAEKVEEWQNAQKTQTEEWAIREQPELLKYVVAKFDQPLDLVGYVTMDNNGDMQVDNFLSNPIDIVRTFLMTRMMLLVIEIVILVVAVMIAIFTFAQIVNHDVNILALYRSVGASTGNIWWIYFLYLLELSLLGMIAACLFGLLIVTVMMGVNANALAGRWKEYYALKDLPTVLFLGVDWHFWLVMLAMLAVAPVALVFDQGRFTDKSIAKRLKED